MPTNTVNDELFQTMIENEKQNRRKNKEVPCWNFEFTNTEATALSNTKIITLEHQANPDSKETTARKIFIPEGNENWPITIKVQKGKTAIRGIYKTNTDD